MPHPFSHATTVREARPLSLLAGRGLGAKAHASSYRFHRRVSPHSFAISSVEEKPASSMNGSVEAE